VPTLAWTGCGLRIIDQRLLPGREKYLDCDTVRDLATAIRGLAVRGAPAIGISAAYGAVLAAMESEEGPSFRESALAGIETLASTRPTAVNLFKALDEQRRILQASASRAEAIAALLASACAMRQSDLEASMAMGAAGASLLGDDARILTHCNAGGLATAGLGTALAVAYESHRLGRLSRVFADETRPLLQGARLTAWELTRAGIPVTVMPDSAAATVLAAGLVQAVFVGADRIASNGDVANKVGTFPLAIAARHFGVPFYVVAPLSTFDPCCADGSAIPVEQRGRDELDSLRGRRIVPASADVFNPAFDVTPSDLVTALICERGLLRKPFDRAIAELTRQT
jgi:methylthioribose-1-phosphate isomerase